MHKYLGININYYSPAKVILSIINYILNIIDNISKEMKGESATPAAHHLFDVAEDATKLYQADTDIFRHL